MYADIVEITAGAFWRPLPSTTNYEATIPLVYDTPWYQNTIKTNSEFTENCVNLSNINLQCRLSHNLNLVESAFEDEFNIWENSWSPNITKNNYNNKLKKREKRALDFLGDGLAWCCGVATQEKLDSVISNENELQEVIDKLQKGLSTTLTDISQQSKQFSLYEQSVSKAFSTTEL